MSVHHISVLVVVGYPLVRHGIALVLGGLPWLAVCAQASESPMARRLCEQWQPDLIVLDMELEGGDGLLLLRDFPRLCPDVKTLALSEREDAPWVQRVLRAGAAGYLSKQDEAGDLVSAASWTQINQEKFVGQRLMYSLQRQFLEESPRTHWKAIEALSDREMEVFRLAGKGQGTTATAQSLKMSVKTVETHHARIKQKLKLPSGGEMRRLAAEWVAAGRKSWP